MLTFKHFIKEYSLEDPAPKRNRKLNSRGETQKAVMRGARGVRGMVFRADNDQKPDRKLRTYITNKDSTESGAASPTETLPKGTKKIKGQFAGPSAKSVSAYAGIERTEPRVMTNKTLYTRKGADSNRSTHITAYKRDNFRQLPSGEMFSNHPGKSVGQFKVQNSTQFRSRYRKEKQVKDIGRTFRRVRNRPDFEGSENV